MLGYQARAPAEQQSNSYQQQTGATTELNTDDSVGKSKNKSKSENRNRKNKEQERQQSVSISPLASHINLINQAEQQQLASPGYHSGNSSPSSSAISSPISSLNSAASPTSNPTPSSAISMATAHTSNTNSNPSSSNSSSSSPSSSRSPISPNLLDYYPELNQDGLGLSWFHDANNRACLTEALMSNKMIISGDISLAEMSRYPVPIMARPPLGVSDITLENWLQDVVHSQPQRGIKLTFTSTRTVEPAFRVLSRHAELIKGPLILSADILASARAGGHSTSGQLQQTKGAAAKQQQQQQQTGAASQPVDAWTFLMLCRTRFPRCIISIGWCAAAPSREGSLSSMDPMFELDVGPIDAAINSISQRHQHAHLYAPISAGKQLGQQHNNNNGNNTKSHLMINHQQLSQHLSQHHHLNNHHQTLSSTGSLNSSSGNSSGSPSPTSPVGHLLMSPPTYYNNHRHRHQHHHHHHQHLGGPNSAGGLVDSSGDSGGSASAAATAAAAAAAMAAAVMAASANHFQQVPLNLNINEADQQLSSSLSSSSSTSSSSSASASSASNSTSLNQLAKKIQSYQSLSSLANSSHHINKKAAIGLTNSNSPSPQSTTNFGAHFNRQQAASMLLKTTANNNSNSLPSAGGYTREMIDKMASLVKEYNLTQPVTFPVEAKLIRGSLAELQRLLYQVGSNSTLTIVAQQDDLINVDDLLQIRKGFATNQLLFDLPNDLAEAFRHELDILND